MCVLDLAGKGLMEIHAVEVQHRREYPPVLRQAKRKRPGWLSRRTCQLVGQMGHGLVAVGERLERYALPQPSTNGKRERVGALQMKEAS
jgi:hypothetical protein